MCECVCCERVRACACMHAVCVCVQVCVGVHQLVATNPSILITPALQIRMPKVGVRRQNFTMCTKAESRVMLTQETCSKEDVDNASYCSAGTMDNFTYLRFIQELLWKFQT